jgi:hypothetical protein
MSTEVLEKIIDEHDKPIPKPDVEVWTNVKDRAFRRCLAKVKCKAKVVNGALGVKPENMILFEKSFDGTPLQHSAIAGELAKELHVDNVWVWFV